MSIQSQITFAQGMANSMNQVYCLVRDVSGVVIVPRADVKIKQLKDVLEVIKPVGESHVK